MTLLLLHESTVEFQLLEILFRIGIRKQLSLVVWFRLLHGERSRRKFLRHGPPRVSKPPAKTRYFFANYRCGCFLFLFLGSGVYICVYNNLNNVECQCFGQMDQIESSPQARCIKNHHFFHLSHGPTGSGAERGGLSKIIKFDQIEKWNEFSLSGTLDKDIWWKKSKHWKQHLQVVKMFTQ